MLKQFVGSRKLTFVLLALLLAVGLFGWSAVQSRASVVSNIMYFVPEASIGHVGVYRDENSLKPVPYYFRFPKFVKGEDIIVVILDPMIATGGSAIYVINKLVEMGIKKIKLASVIAAPEGVKKITEGIKPANLKKVEMFTCCLDDCLNDKGFILPGLGDAGDRLYGT